MTSAIGGVLRVHLIHQGFGDYTDGLLSGLDAVGSEAVGTELTSILSGPASLTRTRSERTDHRSVAVPRFRDPRSPWRARRLVADLLARPCDVVHWQAAGNPWVDLALLRTLDRWPRAGWPGRGRGGGRPGVVLTVHDMQAHPGDHSVLPGTFALIRRLVRRVDRVIVHAEHVAAQAVAAGADPDRVSVLAHGELGSRYLPPDRLPLPPPTEPVVLFFGRAQGYKGLDLADAAFPAVIERVPEARLVVAGTGPAIDEVFGPNRPLPPWCEVRRGLVPAEAVPELFQRAAVVVLPYREASQSGVAALAAGFGRAVVASRVPGLADIVVDGRSGLLVEPGSASALAAGLVDVLGDPDLARELAAGAHRQATTALAWPLIANELVELYHGTVTSETRVVGRGGRRSGRVRRT